MIREREKEKILTFLDATADPVDIEKIRKACGIDDWNTALNYCLTLLIEEKISGRETSEGWIFWAHQEIRLQPWQEVIGTYEALEVGEDNVILTLSRTCRNLKINFVKSSAEAKKLTQTLINTAKGTKIALLKTDDPQKPLLLRVLTQP